MTIHIHLLGIKHELMTNFSKISYVMWRNQIGIVIPFLSLFMCTKHALLSVGRGHVSLDFQNFP